MCLTPAGYEEQLWTGQGIHMRTGSRSHPALPTPGTGPDVHMLTEKCTVTIIATSLTAGHNSSTCLTPKPHKMRKFNKNKTNDLFYHKF